MCPSEHRTATLPDNMAAFLMTNMIPQAPGNDEGPWALLEGYTRDLALQGTQVTDEGIERLKIALPDCDIRH